MQSGRRPAYSAVPKSPELGCCDSCNNISVVTLVNVVAAVIALPEAEIAHHQEVPCEIGF